MDVNPLHACPNCGHSWDDHDLTTLVCNRIVGRTTLDFYEVPVFCDCKERHDHRVVRPPAVRR